MKTAKLRPEKYKNTPFSSVLISSPGRGRGRDRGSKAHKASRWSLVGHYWVGILGMAAQGDPAVWCTVALRTAVPHAKSGAQTPRWQLGAAVSLFPTARIRPRPAGRGLDRPKGFQKHPKRVRLAPWPCVGGIHRLAIRLGATGARNAASRDPCDPPGLRLCPFARSVPWG